MKSEITPEQYVDLFFKRSGIGAPAKSEHFWRVLTKRFGDVAKEFGQSIEARSAGQAANPYPIKNRSLEFANAIASQFDAAKLRAVALWIIREQFPMSGKILEIGCDNGILLCLLASLYPSAKFIGIDSCAEAVELARQRAERLNLTNVEFHASSVDHSLSTITGGGFELILSVAVFHEIFAGGFIGHQAGLFQDVGQVFSIEEADQDIQAKRLQTSSLDVIQDLLHSEGAWVSVDKWRNDAETLQWIRMAEAANLFISLPRSHMIQYKDLESGRHDLPLTVFTKRRAGSPEACDVLSFMAYADFLKAPGLQLIENPMLAELLYGALEKQEIYFQEASFNDGSGTERTCLGVAGGIGYIYTTTNRGYRRLLMLPSALLHEKLEELDTLRSQRMLNATVTHRWGAPSLLFRLGVNPQG